MSWVRLTLPSNDFAFINKFWEKIFFEDQFRQDLGLTITQGSQDYTDLRNYFFGTFSLSVDVINQMTTAGGTIDEYLDSLANEFLRIMNIRLANQGLPTIGTTTSGPRWRERLRESLGTTNSDIQERDFSFLFILASTFTRFVIGRLRTVFTSLTVLH